jgi:hypothetical protein
LILESFAHIPITFYMHYQKLYLSINGTLD